MDAPLNSLFIEAEVKIHSLFHPVKAIREDEQSFFNLESADVVLVYFDADFAKKVKLELKDFGFHFKKISFLDAGSILDQSSNGVLQVFTLLRQMNIVPIMLDLSQSSGIMLINEFSKDKNDTLMLTSKIPNEVSVENPHLGFLAFQRHLMDLDHLLSLDEVSFISASLGMVKRFPNIVEPIMRNVSDVFIDLNVLKASEIGSFHTNYPTGMTSEDVCQCSRIAGASYLSKGLYILVNNDHKSAISSPKLIATMAWYFLEGMQFKRSSERTLTDETIVNVKDSEETLVFCKDQDSRWWVKLESRQDQSFIACMYEEYESTLKGEMPQRLWRQLMLS